jgi:hypothetical protein
MHFNSAWGQITENSPDGGNSKIKTQNRKAREGRSARSLRYFFKIGNALPFLEQKLKKVMHYQ